MYTYLYVSMWVCTYLYTDSCVRPHVQSNKHMHGKTQGWHQNSSIWLTLLISLNWGISFLCLLRVGGAGGSQAISDVTQFLRMQNLIPNLVQNMSHLLSHLLGLHSLLISSTSFQNRMLLIALLLYTKC